MTLYSTLNRACATRYRVKAVTTLTDMPEPRRSKRDKKPGTLRRHLADNLVALRDLKYRHLPNDTKRNAELAKAADTTLSQIQRIIKCELGISIDWLEPLAAALDTRPQDLVTPYFSARLTSEPIPLSSRRRRTTA